MFKVLDEKCTPVRGTKYSAYVDLFSAEDYIVKAGETIIIKLGVKLDLEKLKENKFKTANDKVDANSPLWQEFLKSHYLEVALRSSLGVKGLIIANGIGIIDLDYPDEIGLIVHNPLNDIDLIENYNYCNQNIPPKLRKFKIKKGDKVAQCTLKEHKGYLLGYESDVVRVSGFGSTDKEVNTSNVPNDIPDYFKCNEIV